MIVAIENGHVSGRHVGHGLPDVVAKALEADPARLDDRFAYLTRTEGGKVLKSKAICCRDRTGKPIAIFAMNNDISHAPGAQEALGSLAATGEAVLCGAWRGVGASRGTGAGHGTGAGRGGTGAATSGEGTSHGARAVHEAAAANSADAGANAEAE